MRLQEGRQARSQRQLARFATPTAPRRRATPASSTRCPARRSAAGRAELHHPQVPGAALPAPDLPGGRNRVRRPLGDPRRDQRDRDRLRPQPERLVRRRPRLDAVHALHLAAYGTDANKDGRKDPYNPVDAIFAAARYLKAADYENDVRARDLGLQPRRLVRRLGAAARASDRRRPGRPDRLAHRPHRRPLPRLRSRPLRRRPRRAAAAQARQERRERGPRDRVRATTARHRHLRHAAAPRWSRSTTA